MKAMLVRMMAVLLISTQVAAEAPQVGEAFQRSIDRAWAKAEAGEDPSTSCAGLKGRVVGTGATAEAAQALHACNVEVPVRYFEVAFLDPIEAGDRTCQELMMAMSTKLRAMTISVANIEAMIAAAESGESAEQAAGDAITRAALGDDLKEPRAAIKARLKPRALAACPELEFLFNR